MKKASSLLNLLVALSMVIALFAAGAVPVGAQSFKQQPPPPDRPVKPQMGDYEEQITRYMQATEPTNPMDVIDPALRELAQKGGDQQVEIYVAAKPGVDLSKYLKRMIVRPEIIKGQRDVYGVTTAGMLTAIAQQTGVIAVVDSSSTMREKPYDPEQDDKQSVDAAAAKVRLEQLRQNEKTYKETAKAGGVGASGWFDVLDGHKSKAAWTKGFTGKGVIVGVIDDGVDFGHPDLQGTTAWVTDQNSPYYGWPMAFSQVSLKYFVDEVYFQNAGAFGITQGWNGTRWSDTQTSKFLPTCFECTTGTVSYKPVGADSAHTYTIPLTSASFTYKLGTFHEKNLEGVYGERVAVLVVDEHAGGVYDTVYVDLDNDYDFTDEKPATQNSPEIFRDMDGDGFADISGGQLVWISDGDNLPPGADWLWGVECGDEVGTLKACPNSGSLLLFSGPFDAGYTHGTQCASNVAGQGVVSGGLTAQPFRIGGMVQGGAPDVGVMDFGNHYYAGTDEDEYIMAALGYDGVPYSGDEIQITSNSYGSFTQMWGGWGYIGRLITTLNLTVGQNTVWLFSGGNEGPGWGPQEGDAGPTILKIGTSTQYGSTNWDSIAGIDQIVYGDPSSFGAHGPNRDGSSGLDVLANGGRGAGDEGLNYFGFDGATSWDTWGGTSRSSPVAASNVALGFQAYKERYGRWPAWYEVLPAVKSSATNSVSDPFLQGGGVINADRLTDVAAGVYGVVATPDEWQVGDWEGKHYYNFANVAWPGATYTQTYSVVNPSGYDITVDLDSGRMQRFAEYDYQFTTSPFEAESAFNFHSPDYLIDLGSALGGAAIPSDAELMVVRFVQPYDQFDPKSQFSGTPANSWRFMLYNWIDINKDGLLWIDKNSNGAVNHADNLALGHDNDGFYRVDFANPTTEVQQGEYVRMDYEFGGNGIPIFVRDPLKRMGDGYFLGVQHRINNGTVDQTDFKIRVEFYKRGAWDWLSLDKTQLTVPANSVRTFVATVDVPANAEIGAYEGVIWMNDPGNAWYPAHETALPVVANVINDLAFEGAVHAGGGARTNALYQNSWTNGYFNWYGGGWTGAGDWRHYFFSVDQSFFDKNQGLFHEDPSYMAEKPNLLVHTYWDGGYPTDINSWVLGPTTDCASNGTGRCAWYASDIGQPSPGTFGPYTLQPIGSSDPFATGATYPFHTSTGGPSDWALIPLQRPGLHELALHNVLYDGENIEEQFSADVGTLDLEATMDAATGMVLPGSIVAHTYTDTGQLDLWFTPSLAIPDLSVTLAGGLKNTVSSVMTATVPNNSGGAGGGYSPWLTDNVWRLVQVDTPGTTTLRVHVNMPPTQDIDLFLVLDVNHNGIPEAAFDRLVGSSGNSAGVDEEITLNNPALGQYIVVFNGYAVSPSTGVPTGWYYAITAPGPLPTEESVIVSNTITVTQDASIDPLFSSWYWTFVASERSAAIHATLTDLPVDNDADLYLVDDATSEIVAKSQVRGDGNEELVLKPPTGEYRLDPVSGHQYTLRVHGYEVPDAPITPTLRLWTDELNVWLDYPAANADVSVNEISADETVSATLKYSKTGMLVGDLLSARLIAGPSVLPGALSDLVSITKVNPGTFPDAAGNFTKTVKSDRSRTYADFFDGGSLGLLDSVAVYPGDQPLFTVGAENTGKVAGWFNLWDNWSDASFDFGQFVGAEPPLWDHYISPSGFCANSTRECLDMYVFLNPGEKASYQFTLVKTSFLSSGTPYTAFTNALYGYYYAPDWTSYRALSNAGAAGYLAPWFFGYGETPDLDMWLRSEKSGPDFVVPGESFSYVIGLHNPTSFEKEFYIEDALPKEVEFEGCSSCEYISATRTVAWTVIVPPEGLELSFDVTADLDLKQGQKILNEATVSDKFEGTPFAWLDNTVDVDEGVDLVLRKTVDKLVGIWNDVLTYNIVLRNDGDHAQAAYVDDPLPAHLTLLPDTLVADKGAVTFDSSTNTIHWVGNLDHGEDVLITFKAAIDPGTPTGLILLNPAVAGAANWNSQVYSSAVTEQMISQWYLPAVYNAAPPAP